MPRMVKLDPLASQWMDHLWADYVQRCEETERNARPDPVALNAADDPGSSAFCENCRKLDISVSHFQKSTGGESEQKTVASQDLGTLQKVQKRAQCALCRLIIRIQAEEPLRDIWTDNDAQYSAIWTHEIKDPEEMPASYVLVTFNTPEVPYDYRQCTVRAVTVDQPDLPYSGRIIDPEKIDPELPQNWLARCESDHEHFQMSLEDFKAPACFRLIDVRLNRVVEVSEPCRYLALSYVWGTGVTFQALKSNIGVLSSESGLLNFQDLIPATIIDAMVFTKEIGERYLWVDRICIVQDDIQSKNRVIADMDIVYSQALAVLIVAGAADATTGIPGIGSRPRKTKQLIEEVKPGFYLMAQIHLKDCLNPSVYLKRAWTYQEQQLARRSFVFINDRVYFTCPTHVYSEDVVAEDSAEPDSAMIQADRIHRILGRDDSLATYYVLSVEQYTSRSLTFNSDKLNAFNGILNVHCKGLFAEPFFGTPTSFFDLAILWQPKHALKRIPEFPSWSWAGWSGAVMWYVDSLCQQKWNASFSRNQEYNQITEWLKDRTWIDWYVAGDETTPDKLLWKPQGSEEAYKQISEPVDPATVFQPEAFGYQSSLSTPLNPYGHTRPASARFLYLPEPPSHKLAPPKHIPPGTLHFTTLLLTYKITSSPSSYIRYCARDPYPSDRPTIAIFLLQNIHSEPCGWVQLTVDHMHLDNSLQEFLILSEADYQMEYGRPHEGNRYANPYMGEEGWLEFYCMMVGEREGGGGVRERVGLGRVMKGGVGDAWGKWEEEGDGWREVWLA